MMILINDITSSPDTYEELAKMYVEKLSKEYKIIDVVADYYRSSKLFKTVTKRTKLSSHHFSRVFILTSRQVF